MSLLSELPTISSWLGIMSRCSQSCWNSVSVLSEVISTCEKYLPNQLLMVGNSLKSDIAPALNIGAWAIHIPFHVTWQLEHFDDIEHERLIKITHFNEILKHI